MSVTIILGGTCFQGRGLVQKILDEDRNQHVVIVNRGRTYWGEANPWNNDRVSFEIGDRETDGFTDRFREIISNHTSKEGRSLRAVVDFCCFHPRHIMAILDILVRKSSEVNYLYVLISSDSVYDVCNTRTSKGLVSEKFADPDSRPLSSRRRVSLHRQNRYGGNKLRIEDILRTTPSHFNFLALRLPDVIGPCDDTGRFWATFLLAKFNSSNLHMRKSTAKTKISLVFSEDVQDFILSNIAVFHKKFPSRGEAAADGGRTLKKEVSPPEWDSSSSESWSSSESVSCGSDEAEKLIPVPNEGKSVPTDPLSYRTAVNIGCKESPTVAELVEHIAFLIHNEDKQVSTGRRIATSTADFYPSVDCGPISTDVASEFFSFVPTPLQTVLQKTVSFFDRQTTEQLQLPKEKQLPEFQHALQKLDKGTRKVIE